MFHHENGTIKLDDQGLVNSILYPLPRLKGSFYFCMFTQCNFQTNGKYAIQAHLAMYHTHEELERWGFKKSLLLRMMRANLNERMEKPESSSNQQLIDLVSTVENEIKQ